MGILESLKNQYESWKSHETSFGNLFLQKGTNPVFIIAVCYIHVQHS